MQLSSHPLLKVFFNCTKNFYCPAVCRRLFFFSFLFITPKCCIKYLQFLSRPKVGLSFCLVVGLCFFEKLGVSLSAPKFFIRRRSTETFTHTKTGKLFFFYFFLYTFFVCNKRLSVGADVGSNFRTSGGVWAAAKFVPPTGPRTVDTRWCDLLLNWALVHNDVSVLTVYKTSQEEEEEAAKMLRSHRTELEDGSTETGRIRGWNTRLRTDLYLYVVYI